MTLSRRLTEPELVLLRDRMEAAWDEEALRYDPSRSAELVMSVAAGITVERLENF